MYLFRLVYYSRNVLKDGQGAFKEIKSILNRSVQNNTRAGITGALLFNQQFFAQILEGDRKAVTDTFCRIAKDPRHSDIVILDARAIEERIFLKWAMAFAGHSDVADELYMRFGITENFDPAKMTADALLGFVYELVKHDDHLAKVPASRKGQAA